MALWSTKRRFLYGGGVVVVIALIVSVVFFKLFYRTPTCSDGVKNGTETGVDCGGSCQFLCTSDSLTPVVLWSKIFNISGDVYTVVAYVENPNINSKNSRATYRFRITDQNNKFLTSVEGETSIPKNKKFAIFETGIVIQNYKPKLVDFQFLSFDKWEKDTNPEPNISLTYSTLLATSTVPRIEGKIINNSKETIPHLEVDALVLDSKENVVAASRTFVDNILSRNSDDFVFTWPKPFNLGVEECVSPVDMALVLDKSGSMKSESVNPPEPFTTVKKTAEDFINNLSDADQVSIVSFGITSTKESGLTLLRSSTLSTLKALSLPDKNEETNIAEGLLTALTELRSSTARSQSKKVIVLLTDGTPTEPKSSTVSDYPEIATQSVAKQIKDLGIAIYTIGLGTSVNGEFLQTLSSGEAHYFQALTKENLGTIYSRISQNMCPKKPSVINVIYRTI